MRLKGHYAGRARGSSPSRSRGMPSRLCPEDVRRRGAPADGPGRNGNARSGRFAWWAKNIDAVLKRWLTTGRRAARGSGLARPARGLVEAPAGRWARRLGAAGLWPVLPLLAFLAVLFVGRSA